MTNLADPQTLFLIILRKVRLVVLIEDFKIQQNGVANVADKRMVLLVRNRKMSS